MAIPRRASRPAPPRAELPEHKVFDAFARLARHRAFQTLVRGALPAGTLRRLLKDAMPRRKAAEMPPEVWASLAAGIALQSPIFGMPLAEALRDRLGWDREPADMDGWWDAVRERPLEALWMAALSESKAVKKDLAHIISHCLENFRNSPACVPPSWEFVEGLLNVQAETARELRDAERGAEDAARRLEAERERSEELRDELKKLRREAGELRAGKAHAERRAESLASDVRQRDAGTELQLRADELERKLRKVEKEREHLQRELTRMQDERTAAPRPTDEMLAASGADEAELDESALQLRSEPSLSDDPNPRRRLLRQMLRKLVKKWKIGASHTHEDNVYRGVADHEKGIAKEVMELLYREGFLVPKPTVTDPHVSLRPERLAEVRAIVAGELTNQRLRRFVEA